ncbi:MAG: tetratricopeptide repeat protein [Planctomycetota bacterium]
MREVALVFVASLLPFASLTAQEPSLQSLRTEAQAAVGSREWAEAAVKFKQITQLAPDDGQAWLMLGYSLHGGKEYDKALEAHHKAAEFANVAPTATYNIACVHSLKGDTDQAIEWLQKAVKVGFNNVSHVATDTDMDNVRGDPRFAEVVQKMRNVTAAPRVQAFSVASDRKVQRVAYFAGGSSPGQIVLNFGLPQWQDSYAEALESGRQQGRWRLGKDSWTSMDSNIDLTIGGIKVPAGYYYLTLEQKDDSHVTVAFLDAAKIRAEKLDAFQAQQTSGGIEVPLKLGTSEKIAKELGLAVKLSDGDHQQGEFRIRFGPFTATAPVNVHLDG